MTLLAELIGIFKDIYYFKIGKCHNHQFSCLFAQIREWGRVLCEDNEDESVVLERLSDLV